MGEYGKFALKATGKEFNIKWSTLKRAKAYTTGSKTCNLCLAEKLFISNADKQNRPLV